MTTPDELVERAAREIGRRYKCGANPELTADSRIAIRVALEEALAAVYGETLGTEVDATDTAYNVAINHAGSAIRALLPQEDGE